MKPETLPFLDTHQEWTRNHRALGYKFTCQFTSLLFPLVALCYVPTVCQHPFHPNGCNDRNPYVHWINASESSEFDWVCPLKIGYPQIPRFIIIFHQKSTDLWWFRGIHRLLLTLPKFNMELNTWASGMFPCFPWWNHMTSHQNHYNSLLDPSKPH